MASFRHGLWATLLIATPAAWSAEYFVAPAGADSSLGTRAEPWRTLHHSVGQLHPGDTLVLLDGEWTEPLVAHCFFSARNGLPGQPISVRADHERRALIRSDGTDAAIHITGCMYWSFEGLRAEDRDDPSAFPSNLVSVHHASHLEFKKLLLARPNRYFNANLLEFSSSSGLRVEDCEFYDFHRSAMTVWNSGRAEISGCYVNSRNYPDIDGGLSSPDPTQGDSAVDVFESGGSVTMRNNLFEGQRSALVVAASRWSHGISLINSLVRGGTYGAVGYSLAGGTTPMPFALEAENVAVLDAQTGLSACGTKWTECRGCSFLNTLAGAVLDEASCTAGDGLTSSQLSHVLATARGAGTVGVRVSNHEVSRVYATNAYGFSTPFVVSDAGTGAISSIDPQLGTCAAYLPEQSPMKRASPEGADIGANVLYRYDAHGPTSRALWDPVTGEFPCGAQVTSVNDDPLTACRGAHTRFGVAVPGCPLPADDGQPPTTNDAGTWPSGRTLYVSPSGNDTQSGDESQPFLTFAHALGVLRPGDTLLLLDGIYTAATTGPLAIDCGAGAATGFPGQPITVRAQHERQAWLRGDGTVPMLSVISCSDWNLEGLRVSGDDSPVATSNGQGTVSLVSSSKRVALRRLLLSRNNRYFNSVLLGISYSNQITIEDSELYDFHRGGVTLYISSDCRIRRVYANGRAWADLDGGYGSSVAGADTSFSVYGTGVGHIIENSIGEGGGAAFAIEADNGVMGTLLAGDIALSSRVGAAVTNSATAGQAMPNDTTLVDFVAADTEVGAEFASARGSTLWRATLSTRYAGARAFQGATAGNSLFSTAIADVQATLPGDGGTGFELRNQTAMALARLNAFGTAAPFVLSANVAGSQLDGGFTSALTTVDPQMHGCLVYVPPSSPMKGAGLDGGDIGATVLTRYRDGELTNERLWNPGFPCGAQVAGVNDVPGTSCFDVHQRLNVAADCLPDDYWADAGPSAPRRLTLGCDCDGTNAERSELLAFGLGLIFLAGWQARRRRALRLRARG